MPFSLFLSKRASAVASPSGVLPRLFLSATNPQPLFTNKLSKLSFSMTSTTRIQGDHDWFLISPGQYGNRAPPIPPPTSSSPPVGRNDPNHCPQRALAPQIPTTLAVNKNSNATDATRSSRCFLHHPRQATILAGTVILGLALGGAVSMLDDVLLSCPLFEFANASYSYKFDVFKHATAGVLSVSGSYKLRPSQWVLLGIAKGVAGSMGRKEYGKVWDFDGVVE